MSFSTRERIPLTGADCFLRAFDYEARRYHGASHLAQLVVRLGPGFDVTRFEARLARVVRDHPVLRAAVRRAFGIGAPTYFVPSKAGPGLPLLVTQQTSHGKPRERPIPAVFFERLNDTFALERGDLLRFDIVRYDDGEATDLAMTWAHMLFDASGSEQLIAHLAADDEDGAGSAGNTNGAPAVAGPSFSWRRFAQEAQVARRWGERMVTLGNPPPRSLAGRLRTVRQRLRYTLTTLTVAETATVVERGGRYAGFLMPAMFYLAAAMRAHAAVLSLRRAEPECFLVPLPVHIPPAEKSTLVIGTHVSLMWFRVLTEHARDLGTLVVELKRQRLEQIRDHAIEETATALDFVRLLPLRTYAYMLRRNLHGELASFVFSFTGQFLPQLQTMAGAEVLNAFHAPAVQPSPGSGFIMSIRRGALNIAHVYQDGVMTDAERALLHAHLLDDLLRS